MSLDNSLNCPMEENNVVRKNQPNDNRNGSKQSRISIPSRQPHIGAQSTLKKSQRTGIKNKSLYNYCIYAMKEVQKIRTAKEKLTVPDVPQSNSNNGQSGKENVAKKSCHSKAQSKDVRELNCECLEQSTHASDALAVQN